VKIAFRIYKERGFMHECMDSKGSYKMKQLVEPGGLECLTVINNTQK